MSEQSDWEELKKLEFSESISFSYLLSCDILDTTKHLMTDPKGNSKIFFFGGGGGTLRSRGNDLHARQ